MTHLIEEEPDGERSRHQEGLRLTSNACPVHNRLLNLWLTGEWICPLCGCPDRNSALLMQQEYTFDPRGDHRDERADH